MSYRDALADGLFLLMQNQVPDAGLDARLLLEYVCNTDKQYLLLHGDNEITEEQASKYLELIEKRAKRIPLQHLTGQQEFMGYPFKVNENVLIPRQDTEILVELVSKLLLPEMSVLDVCTGSGCIIISLLRYFSEQQKKNGTQHFIKGTGLDISEKALDVARENARLNHVDVNFIESDLFTNINEKFDIIVSNPPYIVADVIPSLMPEVKEHEPMLALDGGEDGLDFYHKIIESAPQYLNARGCLCFEIGYDQGKAVSDLMKMQGFQNVKVIKDYAGLDRVVVGFL